VSIYDFGIEILQFAASVVGLEVPIDNALFAFAGSVLDGGFGA
jgi:hypothetical protein